MDKTKKTVFSGVQPTGNLTIANYLGAMKNFPPLQDKYNCIYCVVDLHSITVRQDPEKLRKNTYELCALYLACGIDPKKSVLFVQSHVPAHTELSWVLNTFTYVGEMNRMTQFKDKSRKHADNINMGLMDYPVLMASDILLYQTDLVPVGIDQRQHIEITRDIAMRFNSIYGETFKIPESVVPKLGGKVMSLQDPAVKMSKSDENENALVAILDDRDTIIKKFKKAVTDSDMSVRYDEERKPGVSNLITIYSLFTGKSVEAVEKEFDGKGYGTFKMAVGEAVADGLEPVKSECRRLLEDKVYLDGIIAEGGEKAEAIAKNTINDVYNKIGFIAK